MNKIAAFLFWGFFGSITLLGAGIYVAGRSGPGEPKSCTTNKEALVAAEEFHRSFGPSRDVVTQLFQKSGHGIEVTLVFRKWSDAATYSVAPDCTVQFT